MIEQKTAVLVYGEFREFENAHKSWNFLNRINSDLYICTWDMSSERNSLLGINFSEKISEEKILKYFPNAIINISSDINFHTPIMKNNFQWRKLFNMVTISGNIYDNIILIRTDIMLREKNDFVRFLSTIESDRIYGLSEIVSNKPPAFLFVQDCLFFGKFNIMRETFLSFPPPDVSYKDVHYHLSKHFLFNDIYVESTYPMIFDYFIMRSVHREFLDKDFDTQKRISIEWWDAKHRNKTPNETIRLLKEKK